MDGFTTDESVIVLAATNLADTLDPALKRPGRMDRQIQITLPSIDERKEIYNVHLKKIKVNKEKPRDEYARKLSALTPGFSGADIANVCNEGAIIAARTDKRSVSLKEFESATERVIGGIEQKKVMTYEERKTVAYHEAGHAVAGWFLEHSNPLLKITIIPRSKGALGFAQYLPEEVALYHREALVDMIKVALGGRIAEQLFFDTVTTGAHDDIKKVTQIANGLVTTYGMSDALGLVSYQGESGALQPYSEETAAEIDHEVKRLVDECYQETKDLLDSKRDLIAALAEELLQHESINLPQIMKVLGDRPYPLKESIREYLEELEKRQKEETENKEIEDAKAALNEEDAASKDENASMDDADDQVNKDEDSDKMSFDDACARMRLSENEKAIDALSAKDQLELYALYKQGNVGDNKTEKPGLFDFSGNGKLKWEEWKKMEGMSQEDAKAAYVEKVQEHGFDVDSNEK